MRIAHYAPKLWSPGGIASYVRRLGQAQAAFGDEVVYLSRFDEPDPTDTSQHTVSDEAELFDRVDGLNIDVLHLHWPVSTLPDDRPPMVRTMHGNQGSCPSGSRYLKRSGQPCDRAYSLTGCLWGHFIDHCGSRRPHNTFENFRHFKHEQRQAAKIPTLTVSRFLKEQMIRSGCPADHLSVLHSPAPDTDAAFVPPPKAKTPRFVFVGRLEPKKGADWLLRAAAQVEPHVHIDIAGSGSNAYVDKLRQLVADLDLAAQVTFHGWIDETAVYALMQEARAVVFPSVWHEPAGLITLEAAALGRPVIASAVGGIPEYATDAFALRVSPRDVDGLANAMSQLARDTEQATQMGRRGYKLAQTRFAMKPFVERLRAVYLDVARQHRSVCSA
jgi:glycosyltransferase involved in cell wall biosynthesis